MAAKVGPYVFCETCQLLIHTHPEQVFWKCLWHCHKAGGDPLRCHVKPHTPACVHYVPLPPTYRDPASGAPEGAPGGLSLLDAIKRACVGVAS